MRAEFSRLSSSLLSSCDSVSFSLRLSAPSKKVLPFLPPSLPPADLLPLSSTLVLPSLDSSPCVPPFISSSTLGTLTFGELEHHEEEIREVDKSPEQVRRRQKESENEEQERWRRKEQELSEMKHLHETTVLKLNEK